MTTRRSANEDGTGGYFYGYHASFDATDCDPVDDVLDAVARACRAYHHTEYWRDPMGCKGEGPSYVDNIEAKSREAASAFASLTTRVEEQSSRIEELEGALREIALDVDRARRGHDKTEAVRRIAVTLSQRVCSRCIGTGLYSWSDTSMGGGGLAGQSITEGPCPGTKRSAKASDCPVVLASRALQRDATEEGSDSEQGGRSDG